MQNDAWRKGECSTTLLKSDWLPCLLYNNVKVKRVTDIQALHSSPHKDTTIPNFKASKHNYFSVSLL